MDGKMIEDLTKYLKNPNDKNQEILDVLNDRKKPNEWYAGDQLIALQYYLNGEVELISSYKEDEYQGSIFAILFINGKYFLWRDSFGSCSGCDALENCNEKAGYDYIVKTMTSVKEFNSLKEIWKYLEKPSDFHYESKEIIKKLKERLDKRASIK